MRPETFRSVGLVPCDALMYHTQGAVILRNMFGALSMGIHHERDGCPKTPVGASKVIIDSRSEDTVKVGLVNWWAREG